MTSIGHRTGLFDAMRDQPPQTSREIASRARLNERYVREWLGAMVTSGVVSVDADSARYQLPAEHAAFLTRAAGADNMAVFAAVRCPEVMRLTPAPDRFRRRRGGDRPDGRPRQSAAPDRPYAG
jgi:DNA-binding IclR family transcriptional regulator